MRKMLMAALLMCTVALLSTLSMPAVSAQPKGALKCELFIKLNWNWEGFPWGTPGSKYTWIGTVWGDINGNFYVTLQGASYPGKTEHFSETWIIVTVGGSIKGFDDGVWASANLKWVANGRVTEADGTWSYLVGYNMHYGGTTTEFPAPVGTPVNGTGTLHLSPRA